MSQSMANRGALQGVTYNWQQQTATFLCEVPLPSDVFVVYQMDCAHRSYKASLLRDVSADPLGTLCHRLTGAALEMVRQFMREVDLEVEGTDNDNREGSAVLAMQPYE